MLKLSVYERNLLSNFIEMQREFFLDFCKDQGISEEEAEELANKLKPNS